MRLLVLGGTRFVGRHIVDVALAHGHEVTIVHRGKTGADLFPQCEHVIADRDIDLGALSGRIFDATIDVSAYFPRQVRSLHDVLGQGAGRYFLVSTVSVYDKPVGRGYDESSPLLPAATEDVNEITNDTYGPLKVTCELVARELYGENLTIIRPTYVIGPWDYTRRFTSWVERIAAGGEVLAPGAPEDPTQAIDARDMATWIVGLIEDDTAGTFHAVGPSTAYTFGELLGDVLAAVAPAGTTITWVDSSWLLEQGADYAEFPLWSGDDPAIDVMTADPAAALATGLKLRSIQQSVTEIHAHITANPPTNDSPRLSDEREVELLAAWHTSH
jgi:2'-hydroxyisoflavone reductase